MLWKCVLHFMHFFYFKYEEEKKLYQPTINVLDRVICWLLWTKKKSKKYNTYPEYTPYECKHQTTKDDYFFLFLFILFVCGRSRNGSYQQVVAFNYKYWCYGTAIKLIDTLTYTFNCSTVPSCYIFLVTDLSALLRVFCRNRSGVPPTTLKTAVLGRCCTNVIAEVVAFLRDFYMVGRGKGG